MVYQFLALLLLFFFRESLTQTHPYTNESD